jgi:SAM-dependent methyltransferase
MSDWTAGYMAEVAYTFGYYTELNPQRVKLAFINAGLVAPEIGTACELGFGQGMSANMHAAASVTQWYGTDFNPSQAAFAQELASVSGAGATLYDDAFADFCDRPDLPSFDYIGLHGIWSWISDANRAVIVDFIHRKLKVGGVLYISYNTLPGWSAFAPMRHLLSQHAQSLGADGAGITQRIDGALSFADQVLATKPAYLRANPTVSDRFAKLKEQKRNYLAHEYFNAHWYPMYFSDVSQWLAPAKVGFACSAHLLDQVEPINLTNDQQALLQNIPDPTLRETTRDYIVNQQFRKDYWVKGPRKLNPIAQMERMRSLRFVLTTPLAEVGYKVTGALGEAGMAEAIYRPLLQAVADHKPRTFSQLELQLKDSGVGYAQLAQAVTILVGQGYLHLAHDDAVASKARKHTEKLNAHLMNLARYSAEVSHLACPLTGGGVVVARFMQLFLLARACGRRNPDEWVSFAWNILLDQGQRILKDGKQLDTTEQNMAELTAQANTFSQTLLPMYKALLIA